MKTQTGHSGVCTKSVVVADRSGDGFLILYTRAARADALHAAGEWKKAADLFADAERRQLLGPWLYSVQGYRYCDLLLSQRRVGAVRDRAAKGLEIARKNQWLLEIALDKVTLGRANFALAFQRPASGTSPQIARDDARAAAIELDEAIERLRASGAYNHLPRGLLARAAFRRAVGDWDGAARELDEVKEIAEPGPMRLYLCDGALERARLALARREAFAPLAGLVTPSPPPPALPDAAETARLLEEARRELGAACKLVGECGYHRRDEELAELDDVLAGRRRFADLPARV
jgi:hypothetical protein